MKKTYYIDLMEKVISAYSREHIENYTKSVEENSIEEHGFPRLVANLGILIAHGRKLEYKEQFKKMMDLCCREIPVAKKRNRYRTGNDFSVKEIVFCILEVEKAQVFEKSVTDAWRADLSVIDPYETYSSIPPKEPGPMGNWSAFGAFSEQMRKYAGIGDESDFIEYEIASQMFAFDENGMYKDPHEPILYDFVGRLQLAGARHFGYNGKYKEKLEEQLLKSADITLEMQSVSGDAPFGGRSCQFLHNPTLYASICEFYAVFFKKRGDLSFAGKFKSAASYAMENFKFWLVSDELRHIKNFYPRNTSYGCEDYAYFDKYMVTCASWLYLAYAFADDEIAEVPCPAIATNSICETSEAFRKVLCRFGDYTAEFELKADEHYDASGLGRIHKRGAPETICLSVPFQKYSDETGYKVDIVNPSGLAICAGIEVDGKFDYTYDAKTKYKLSEKILTNDLLRVKFECETERGGLVYQTLTITNDGVEFKAEGDGALEILFPAFYFDGKDYTDIKEEKKTVKISYKGAVCEYSSDYEIIDREQKYANRNGHYKAYAVRGENEVSLKIKIS